MAGITLSDAQTNLTEALAALQRAREAAGYSIKDRSKTNPRIEACLEDVKFWDQTVKRLSGGGRTVRGITPSDG